MTTYRLMDGLSGRPGNGPSSTVSFTGSVVCGVTFMVTSEAYFQGYWWWVAPSGQSTSPVKCALWCEKSGSGDLVAGATVTSGMLTAGAWNYIPLATPVALTLGASSSTWLVQQGAASYIAAIGVNGNFPETSHQFGAGNTYAAGIVNGPLTGFSAPSGSLPSTWNNNQSCFTVAGSDPSLVVPRSGDNDSNLWVDVQVTDTAPQGIPLRLWPSMPTADASPIGNDTATSSSATEFRLASSAKLGKIWFYSPAGAVDLPQRCGIWDIGTTLIVSGTDNASPTWSGAAASGWVYVDYSGAGVTLPAGSYRVATWNGVASKYYTDTEQIFQGTGPFANGITFGPLSAPNAATASNAAWDDSSGNKPSQDVYQLGAWAYPNTGETKSGAITAESRWQDVEVTPSAAFPSPAAGAGTGTAQSPLAAVAVNAAVATGTGAARSAVVATSGNANVAAGLPTGTGTARNATAAGVAAFTVGRLTAATGQGAGTSGTITSGVGTKAGGR